jgi:hypothetical protein
MMDMQIMTICQQTRWRGLAETTEISLDRRVRHSLPAIEVIATTTEKQVDHTDNVVVLVDVIMDGREVVAWKGRNVPLKTVAVAPRLQFLDKHIAKSSAATTGFQILLGDILAAALDTVHSRSITEEPNLGKMVEEE